jgi:hypothetical protein
LRYRDWDKFMTEKGADANKNSLFRWVSTLDAVDEVFG